MSSSNIIEFLNFHRILIKFYTSTCEVCNKFAPEYDLAAREVQLSGLGVTFAKVDLESNLGLKKRFNIKTYPRILLWDNSRSYKSPIVKRYFKKFGLTAQRLSKWVRTQVRIPLRPSPSCKLNEHTCDKGGCLNSAQVCDGSKQCRDGTDETYCSLGLTEILQPTVLSQGNQGAVRVYDVSQDSSEQWVDNYVTTATTSTSSATATDTTTTSTATSQTISKANDVWKGGSTSGGKFHI